MDNGKPTWEVQGRYEYWAVDEHREGSTAVYGTVDTFKTKKQATTVANALNAAYRRGNHDCLHGIVVSDR